jgi:DNA-binding beta-propeller fold protein YncE
MESSRFDAFVRALHGGLSRRDALAALLGALPASLLTTLDATGAGQRQRGKGRRRGGNGREDGGTAQAQAAPARCFSKVACRPGPGANLSRCDFGRTAALAGSACNGCNLTGANFRGADISGANLGGANLGRACLVDADLTGANLGGARLGGAIFCHTRMPDGTLNDSGCDKGTGCCPTCIGTGQPCETGTAASCCGPGRCLDGVCVPPPTSCAPDSRLWTAQMVFGRGERPFGVAVSPDGQTLWVADTLNDRITVWTRSGGVFVQQTSFGSRGSRPHQFNAPNDVAAAADGRTVWVADRGNHRVSVWVRSGNAWVNLTTFGSRGVGLGQLNNPSGIAVSPDGQTVWVLDLGNDRISVWKKSGAAWDNAATFGGRGDASDQFRVPGAIAVSDDGQTVLAADTNNDRIAVWTKSGGSWIPLATFGSRGPGASQFRSPSGVAVSADGQIAWVVDTGNNRIAVWTGSGNRWTSQTTFGSRGSRPNQFDGPLGVAVAADEQTVWVADTLNNRVSVWALTCPPA